MIDRSLKWEYYAVVENLVITVDVIVYVDSSSVPDD